MNNITAQNSAITTNIRLVGNMTDSNVTDLAGRLTGKTLWNIYGSPIRSMSFSYNTATGNMTSRSGMSPESETFTYDNLDRLTGIQYGSGSAHDISYAPNGNNTMQTDIGRYYYEGSRPHAVTSVDNTRHRIPTSQLQTQFNVFGKVSQIRDYGENNYKMLFDYGPDDERWRTRFYRNTSTLQRTTYYMGDYEEIVEGGITRRLYYLDGNVLYKKQTICPDSIFYLFTDHLGSVIAIVDQNGSEKFEATYDAWGNQTITRNDIGFHRGYTGHEMLPEFGLINMNGRLYDPQIGRFLSTDNFVQEPWNSQNFNRYSYCLNNPLKYTDPDGEWFGIDDLIAIILGGTLNLGANLIQGNVNSFWQGLALFGVGAAAGEAALYSGGAAPFVSSGIISVGNDIVNQSFTNGFGNINWNQVGINFLMSEAVAGMSIGIGSMVGPNISDFVKQLGIESPAVNEMLLQAFQMGATGTVIEGGLTLANGGTMEEAGNAALRGGAFGMVSGALSGFAGGVIESRRQNISPWTGEKLQRHHSFPKSLGGDINQELTPMSTSRHQNLHKEMNQYLKAQTKDNMGKTVDMYPRKGNSGYNVQHNFTDSQRFNAVKGFYDLHPVKYYDARIKFYKNNGIIFQAALVKKNISNFAASNPTA